MCGPQTWASVSARPLNHYLRPDQVFLDTLITVWAMAFKQVLWQIAFMLPRNSLGNMPGLVPDWLHFELSLPTTMENGKLLNRGKAPKELSQPWFANNQRTGREQILLIVTMAGYGWASEKSSTLNAEETKWIHGRCCKLSQEQAREVLVVEGFSRAQDRPLVQCPATKWEKGRCVRHRQFV